MDEALKVCMERNLYSATEFRNIIHYLDTQVQKQRMTEDIEMMLGKPVTNKATTEKVANITVQNRDLNQYSEIFGGELHV
jgi:hypothetical protein